jgi:O-antigen/teichoic acid export membrane protein
VTAAIAAAMKAAGALGWLGYSWLLACLLPAEALGPLLFALALAGLLGALAGAGWAQLILREGAAGAASRSDLARLLGAGLRACLRSTALAAAVLAAAGWAGLLPFGAMETALVAVSVVLTGTGGLLAAGQRASGRLWPVLLAQGPLRPGLPAALTALAALHAPPGPASCLGLFAAGTALSLLPLLPGLPRPARGSPPRAEAATLWQGQAGWLLFCQLDMLVAGLVLAPAPLAGYLLARRIAGSAGLVFDALRLLEAPAIARGFRNGHGRVAAEKANLSFLVGGGLAFTALALAGPLLLPFFGPAGSGQTGVLLGLLAVQAIPACLGATGLVMVMAGEERARRRLIAAACPLAAAALYHAALDGALALAWTAAAAHLLLVGTAARRLARRYRIRPGVALLAGARNGAVTPRSGAEPRAGSGPGSEDPRQARRAANTPRRTAPAGRRTRRSAR